MGWKIGPDIVLGFGTAAHVMNAINAATASVITTIDLAVIATSLKGGRPLASFYSASAAQNVICITFRGASHPQLAKKARLDSRALADAMRRLFAANKIWNEPCGRRDRGQFRIARKP